MGNPQALAAKLIAKHGRTITLRKLSTTPANASEPWKGNTTTHTDLQLKAVFVGPGEALGAETENNSFLRTGEQHFLVAGSEELLEQYDLILDGAVSWKIERVETLQPGAQRVLHALVVSR